MRATRSRAFALCPGELHESRERIRIDRPRLMRELIERDDERCAMSRCKDKMRTRKLSVDTLEQRFKQRVVGEKICGAPAGPACSSNTSCSAA